MPPHIPLWGLAFQIDKKYMCWWTSSTLIFHFRDAVSFRWVCSRALIGSDIAMHQGYYGWSDVLFTFWPYCRRLYLKREVRLKCAFDIVSCGFHRPHWHRQGLHRGNTVLPYETIMQYRLKTYDIGRECICTYMSKAKFILDWKYTRCDGCMSEELATSW